MTRFILLALLVASPLAAQSGPITSINISLPANPDAKAAGRPGAQPGVQSARLVAPVNGAVLLADDARRGVAFRWTPLIPRPRDDGAAYRVRVWQLMQGDDGMKAKARTPILEKKGITEAQLIVPLPLGGSCTVQSPCHFVWNVQALNRVGTPTPGADGSDNTFRFAVGGPAK